MVTTCSPNNRIVKGRVLARDLGDSEPGRSIIPSENGVAPMHFRIANRRQDRLRDGARIAHVDKRAPGIRTAHEGDTARTFTSDYSYTHGFRLCNYHGTSFHKGWVNQNAASLAKKRIKSS